MSIATIEKTSSLSESLLGLVQGHFHPDEIELLRRACTFAQEHYAAILHPIGEKYSDYMYSVAKLLLEIGAKPIVVTAAILTPPPVAKQTFNDLKKQFKDTPEVLGLLHEVLSIGDLEWSIWPDSQEESEFKERQISLKKAFLLAIDEAASEEQSRELLAMAHFQKKEKQIRNLIRMLFAAAHDGRALIIKLVDRLYLMRSLKYASADCKEALQYQELAKISLLIYAPIAEQLGTWQIKSELEDMAFRLLQPGIYKEIASLLQKKQNRKGYLDHWVIPTIRKKLGQYKIKATITGRPKHIYSIYRKMDEKHLDFKDINDLLAVRIIVDTSEACYKALSILFAEYFWSEAVAIYGGKAGRDWIAHPKPNQYRSLHTTLLFENKKVEVQIRTNGMHEVAEYGANAAHWRYKESKAYRKGKISKEPREEDQFWSEQIGEMRKSLEQIEGSAAEQRSGLQSWIFVITPKGHVLGLPADATPLDFAYLIHSEVGHKYAGARVNGRNVSTGYELKNGETVEIRTSRTRKGPNPEWLARHKDKDGKSYYAFARTRQARSKIQRWLKLNAPK